mgnify:FL=1
MQIDSPTLELTKQLISRQSVTPEDDGCQQLMTDRLAKAGFNVIEKNESHSGNIRVIARYAGSGVAAEPLAESHALVAVQLQRKWGPYLIQQLLAGTFLSKLRTRSEEKREARRYADGRALLASLYR